MTDHRLHDNTTFVILSGMATVGERYQLVIERHARETLKVRPGDRAVEIVDGDRLIVTFLPGRHRRSLRGRLGGRGRIADFADYRDGDALSGAARDEDTPPVEEAPVEDTPPVEEAARDEDAPRDEDAG